MDTARGQGGIQMLLTAEHEAQQIVAAARNSKNLNFKMHFEAKPTCLINCQPEIFEELRQHVASRIYLTLSDDPTQKKWQG